MLIYKGANKAFLYLVNDEILPNTLEIEIINEIQKDRVVKTDYKTKVTRYKPLPRSVLTQNVWTLNVSTLTLT
jgi:hypothetical protein